MDFKQVKAEILELAIQENACAWGYGQAENAKSHSELIKLIKGYISWCIKHKVATAKNLKKWFGVEFLKENNIYITGAHELQLTQQDTMILVLGRAHATIKAGCNFGHNIILGENSSAAVIAQNSTSIGIDTYKSSYVSVWAKNDSTVRILSFDESSVTAQVADSTATVIIN